MWTAETTITSETIAEITTSEMAFTTTQATMTMTTPFVCMPGLHVPMEIGLCIANIISDNGEHANTDCLGSGRPIEIIEPVVSVLLGCQVTACVYC